jgi:hypothetical protein
MGSNWVVIGLSKFKLVQFYFKKYTKNCFWAIRIKPNETAR